MQCLLLGRACVQHTPVGEVVPVLPALSCPCLPGSHSHGLHFQLEQSSSHRPPAGAAQGSHPVTCGAACEVLLAHQAEDLRISATPVKMLLCTPAAWQQDAALGCVSWILPAPGSTRSALSLPALGAFLIPGDHSSCRDRSELQGWLGLAADLEVTKEERQVLQAKGDLRRDLRTWSLLPLFPSEGLALHEGGGQSGI